MPSNQTLPIPDLSGKTIFITGGNAGIGAATVHALAARGPSRIFVCARSPTKAASFMSSVRQWYPEVSFELLQLDLASFDSVRACVSTFKTHYSLIDLLFLNAGVSNVVPGLTQEGYEMQFGVNHMGHALLTQLLLPSLLESARRPGADVRIIATSSNAASAFIPKTTLALSDMRRADAFGGMTLYGHSKLANLLFTAKLAQLYPSIISVSAHPGTVLSEIWDKSGPSRFLMRQFTKLLLLGALSSDEGAKSQLWCGVVERGRLQNGGYYNPVGKRQRRLGTDRGFMDELWDWTSAELARYGGPGWVVA